MHTFLRLSCFTFVASASIGCLGSDDEASGGGGGYSSGVDGSKTLESLSEAETQSICDSAADYVSDYVKSGEYQEFVCRLIGLTYAVQLTSGQADTCKSLYDSCKTQISVTVSPTANCVAPTTCSATVSDLEQCLTDQDTSLSTTEVPTCSEVNFSTFTQASLEELTGGANPASCMMLDKDCPGATELINPDVQATGI